MILLVLSLFFLVVEENLLQDRLICYFCPDRSALVTKTITVMSALAHLAS